MSGQWQISFQETCLKSVTIICAFLMLMTEITHIYGQVYVMDEDTLSHVSYYLMFFFKCFLMFSSGPVMTF